MSYLVLALAYVLSHAIVLACWPRRRGAALPVMLAADAVFYAALWREPGWPSVLLAMAMAGATLRVADLTRTLPDSTSRWEFLRLWTFTQRHPQDPPRAVPGLRTPWRLLRGLALCGATVGLLVLGDRVQPWRIHPYLDDLWVAAELVCLGVGQVDLVTPLATRLGLSELLLSVEAFHPGVAWSRSLREFWSGRWNRPTSGCLGRAVFYAAGGRHRLTRALLATFFVSGLLHAPPLLLAGAGPDRAGWVVLAVGTLLFFVLHGVGCLLDGALARGRRWLRRPLLYATFLLTLPLYPAPLFIAFGAHQRPLESATPLVLLRALGCSP